MSGQCTIDLQALATTRLTAQGFIASELRRAGLPLPTRYASEGISDLSKEEMNKHLKRACFDAGGVDIFMWENPDKTKRYYAWK